VPFGILNGSCAKVFGQINDRTLCKGCRDRRKQFDTVDKKGTGHFSNALPGFSSSIVEPLDVLIVADSHSGARKKCFRDQGGLDGEVRELYEHYCTDELTTYHQLQIRNLLQELNKKQKTWVFTDLVKCYVWHRNTAELNGAINRDLAIKECRKYLKLQIECLNPHTILCLGKTVFTEVAKLLNDNLDCVPSHGQRYGDKMVFSYFPSARTADLFVMNKEWNLILENIG
jgi:Uracil DNA glycosylase superfamily